MLRLSSAQVLEFGFLVLSGVVVWNLEFRSNRGLHAAELRNHSDKVLPTVIYFLMFSQKAAMR